MTVCSCRSHSQKITQPFFFLAAELEFAQVLIIVVVVTVMVVVVVCLLNHYKVSTRSFINRPNQSQRQEDGLQPVSVWARAIWNAPGLHSGVANPGRVWQGLEGRIAHLSAHCGTEVSGIWVEG